MVQHHQQPEERPQNSGKLPATERPLDQLTKMIERLRRLYQSPAWGHPKGLAPLLPTAKTLPQRAPAQCQELRTLVEGIASSLERMAATGLLKPQEVLLLLRSTLFSDSCAVAFAALRAIDPLATAKNREQRCERATHTLTAGVRDTITQLLERQDADDLADSWELLVDRLDPGDGDDVSIDALGISTMAEFVPVVIEVAGRPNDPRAHYVASWMKDRNEQKELVKRIIAKLAA